MDDRQILESLAGEICAGCGKAKKARRSHCSNCYFALPIDKRNALYKRFDHGYQEAFRDSLEFLKGVAK